MRKLASALIALTLAVPTVSAQSLKGADTDTYAVESSHAFLTWSVKHNDLSTYTVTFTDFDAALNFDSDTPENSTLSVTINPLGLQTVYPDPKKRAEWEEELSKDKKFLNADNFPAITFNSTQVTRTDEFTGTVTGDLTFLGLTKPVTLDVKYNGSANMPWYGQRDLLGFDATTTLKRSDWGMTSMLGVISDDVTIKFSGEFLQDE